MEVTQYNFLATWFCQLIIRLLKEQSTTFLPTLGMLPLLSMLCRSTVRYISDSNHFCTYGNCPSSLCYDFSDESTELLINATRRAVDKFSIDINKFVAENDHIIEEISKIIASLGDVHTRINMVILFIHVVYIHPIPIMFLLSRLILPNYFLVWRKILYMYPSNHLLRGQFVIKFNLSHLICTCGQGQIFVLQRFYFILALFVQQTTLVLMSQR